MATLQMNSCCNFHIVSTSSMHNNKVSLYHLPRLETVNNDLVRTVSAHM